MVTTSSAGGGPTVHSLDPERLVGIEEAARLLRTSSGRINHWYLTGRLECRGHAWKERWASQPHRVYRLGDILNLLLTRPGIKRITTPLGCLTIRAATQRMKCGHNTILRYLRMGQLRGVRVPYSKNIDAWFVYEDSVEEWLKDRNAEPPPSDGILPALICARDETCLQARRELWSSKGRKWGRKFWKGVDRRKRAG